MQQQKNNNFRNSNWQTKVKRMQCTWRLHSRAGIPMYHSTCVCVCVCMVAFVLAWCDVNGLECWPFLFAQRHEICFHLSKLHAGTCGCCWAFVCVRVRVHVCAYALACVRRKMKAFTSFLLHVNAVALIVVVAVVVTLLLFLHLLPTHWHCDSANNTARSTCVVISHYCPVCVCVCVFYAALLSFAWLGLVCYLLCLSAIQFTN